MRGKMLHTVGALLIVTLLSSGLVHAQEQVFTARSTVFQNGNDGITISILKADLIYCVCQYLQPSLTTNSSNSDQLVQCPLSSAGGIQWANTSTEKCFADTNECDVTQSFFLQGSTPQEAAQIVTAIKQAVSSDNGASFLAKCPPNQVAAVVLGEGMARPDLTAPVITGFVIALVCGYLGFSIVLLAGFCLVHRVFIGSEKDKE
jgi:hypothetical protein